RSACASPKSAACSPRAPITTAIATGPGSCATPGRQGKRNKAVLGGTEVQEGSKMQKKILLGIVAPMIFAASGHAAMAQLGSTTSAPPPDDNRPNRSAQ